VTGHGSSSKGSIHIGLQSLLAATARGVGPGLPGNEAILVVLPSLVVHISLPGEHSLSTLTSCAS